MEKNAILGEILYIGLVYEKTRCKSPGLWKRSYVRNLDKHIELLKKVAKCIQAPFNIENDNMLLEEVLLEIQDDSNLRNYYPLKESYMLKTQGMIITECETQNNIIINFVIRLLDDLLLELRKGFRKDKEKICKMIFSLHNLPRVYLNKEKNTLCMLGQEGIPIELAFTYSKLSMDEEMITKYKQFFTYVIDVQ